jgi:hypothetical protein
LKKYWKIVVAVSSSGLLIACAYATYLFATYPNRNPRVESLFDFLCPTSFLTLIYMDVPSASTAQYVVVWALVALTNAMLYGVVGVVLIRLVRLAKRSDQEPYR